MIRVPDAQPCCDLPDANAPNLHLNQLGVVYHPAWTANLFTTGRVILRQLTAITGFIRRVIKRRRTPSSESISLPPTAACLMPNLVAFAGDLVTGDAELQKCRRRLHLSADGTQPDG